MMSLMTPKTLLLVTVIGLFTLTPTAFAAPGPCSANAESRSMDFWLGVWKIGPVGQPGTAISNVHLDLDQCLLIESWDGGKGHKGENFFAYSAEEKTWHGFFLDNDGRVHSMPGKVTAGSAEFSGPSRNEKGETVLDRVKITRLSADKVEEHWEKSSDNGKTWTSIFRGEYSRK